MNQEEQPKDPYGEIDLMDYVGVILKRKLLILVLCLGLAGIVGALSHLLPKVYRINTVLRIGMIGKDSVKSPSEVMGEINSNIYVTQVREKLNIAEDKFPKIKTENPTGTNLIKLEAESSETQKAKNILEEINNLILEEHQQEIKTQKELTEKNIKTIESKIQLSESDIEKTKNKITSMEEDIKRTENKIVFAEEEKKNLEDKEKVLEQLSPYQQINQQLNGSLFTLLDIREKLAIKKQEIEDLYLNINSLKTAEEDLQIQINSLKENIENFNSEMNSLRALLENIKPTEIAKAPMISEKPVKPKTALNMIIAGILGLFMAIFLAFFQEWWDRNSIRI